MKIGILEAGLLRDEMAGRFDPYPAMFERFIDQSGQAFDYDAFSVVRGEMPASIEQCDGWLITGSRHGVYDDLGWMPALGEFIRDLAAAKKPLIGVCFGHQIVADALGGKVVKSDKGWGVGLHHYRIDAPQDWMREVPESVGLYAFHQDQIVELPPDAQVFSSSEFCPYAGLAYGDSIISVQAHPEFEAIYEEALLDAYGGGIVPADVTAAARASMAGGRRADTRLVADWFAEFFRTRHAATASGAAAAARA